VDVSGQPDVVLKAAADLGLTLSAVLTTHKHWDHAGGNDAMKDAIPGLRVLGSLQDAVEGCTQQVRDGEGVSAAGLAVRCLQTPGHTLGHICYYIECDGEHCVFTGDTLFVGGYDMTRFNYVLYFSDLLT
jgi:hydroxyacylglutathione hydrolase